MPQAHYVALVGFVIAALAMLQVTQTKGRAAWPLWIAPALFAAVSAALTALAAAAHGFDDFWPQVTQSWWGVQQWQDRLMSLAVAFFMLQERARAAGMKSEVWVVLVIFTGSFGLLLMLARTLYQERRQAAATATA